MELTQELLKTLVRYDPETGIFVRISTGKQVGNKQTGGYIRFRLCGQAYLAHRLAWLYMTGAWPRHSIDHINRNTSENRFSNLREATYSENGQNQPLMRRNRYGLPGVTWVGRNKKWKASIKVNGKDIYLGLFKTADEASKAYLAKKRELHPFFSGDAS
jgi:hypothetical protein